MRSILGLRRPNAGRIEVLGVDAMAEDPVTRRHIERNTGVLFQDGALFSSLTVGENVQVPLKEYYPDLPDSLRYELALLKIKLAGLRGCAGQAAFATVRRHAQARRPRARAVAGSAAAVPRRTHRRPRPDRRRRVRRADPHPAAGAGLTVFLITHDLDTLYAICDRVAVLADRKVIAVAPVTELEKLDHPWVQEYFNGPRGRAARA